MNHRFEASEPVSPESYWTLDALRPGDALPNLPGLDEVSAQRLRDRLARHDAQVIAALNDLPVPNGLAARLLADMQVELAAQPREPEPALDSSNHEVASAHTRRHISRRAALIGAAAAVAAAGLVAVRLFSPPEPEITAAALMEATIGRFSAERELGVVNHDLDSAPHDFPLSSDIASQVARWRWIDDPPLGRRAVAYDLSISLQQSRATLYVMEGSIDGLITAPPPTPTYPPTQGACAAAWQSGGLVYVLVVEGTRAEYQRFLRHPGGPIA